MCVRACAGGSGAGLATTQAAAAAAAIAAAAATAAAAAAAAIATPLGRGSRRGGVATATPVAPTPPVSRRNEQVYVFI